jgi:hypothetical protein
MIRQLVPAMFRSSLEWIAVVFAWYATIHVRFLSKLA